MKKCKICGNKICDNGSSCFQKPVCLECEELIKKLDFNRVDHERKWTEELFMKRFNYFLLVFSLIVTGGFSTDDTISQAILFYFGFILLLLYWQTGVLRSYFMYDRNLFVLHRLSEKSQNKDSYITVLYHLQEKRPYYHFGLRHYPTSKWMGFLIPLICILFLLTMGILATFCVI
jgi:hypothetical protein